MELEEKDINEANFTGAEKALYLIPVPLSDVSPSHVLPSFNTEIVLQIKHFVVENVRTARRFLKKFDRSINIDSLTFFELSEHTTEQELPDMLGPLAAGVPVGIMSEAGCPAVADPGARLVALAHEKGYKVIPLVGPSSILMALMASGLNGQKFSFEGYLPIDERAREQSLRNMAASTLRHDETHIFIETPYRNNSLFATMLKVLPDNVKLTVASDITGKEENIRTQRISAWRKNKTTLNKIPTIFLLGQ